MTKYLKRVRVLLLLYSSLFPHPTYPPLVLEAIRPAPVYSQVPGALPLSYYWIGNLKPGQTGTVVAVSSDSCGDFEACGDSFVHLISNGLVGAHPCQPDKPSLRITAVGKNHFEWWC